MTKYDLSLSAIMRSPGQLTVPEVDVDLRIGNLRGNRSETQISGAPLAKAREDIELDN
jgi:hypothetical protein